MTKEVKVRKVRKSKAANKQPDVFRTISDETGNLLICKNNGKRVALSLKLIAETKTRRIGVINIARKIFEVRRKRSKHLFRANTSYGFNHKLLDEAKLFTQVRLSDESQEWLIPKEYILENGSFLHFKNPGGFERQIFIELNKITQFEKQPKI